MHWEWKPSMEFRWRKKFIVFFSLTTAMIGVHALKKCVYNTLHIAHCTTTINYCVDAIAVASGELREGEEESKIHCTAFRITVFSCCCYCLHQIRNWNRKKSAHHKIFFSLPLPMIAANKMKMFLIGKPICSACFVTLFYFYYLDGTRYHGSFFRMNRAHTFDFDSQNRVE